MILMALFLVSVAGLFQVFESMSKPTHQAVWTFWSWMTLTIAGFATAITIVIRHMFGV